MNYEKAVVKNLPSIKDLSYLLINLKKDIQDDYRAHIDADEDDLPGMQVTIGWDHLTGEWAFQTGDNSFSGPVYFYKTWAIVYLYRRSNCRNLAKDARAELLELAPEEGI